MAVLIIIAIVISGIAAAVVLSGDDGPPVDETNIVGNNAVVQVNEVSDGDFHYYEYDYQGVAIKYFVVKGTDGELHTAFDACDVCYHAGKGYTRDGEKANCENCGLQFDVNSLGDENQVGGGCWPGYLPHTTEGSELLITLPDLQAGKYYFS